MSNNSQENGAISLNDAISLLATPEQDKVEQEGRQEEELLQPVEAEAEVTDEGNSEELAAEESDFDDEDDADEAEETENEVVEEEDEEEPTYTVRVDGDEYEVTLDELRNGYSRTQFYTKRSQELAAERKAVEQEAAEAKQARESYAQQLEVLKQQIQQTTPQEPDWVALAKEVSAEEYNAYKAQFEQQKNYLAQVEAEQQRVAQEQNAEREKQLQEHLRAQRQEMLNRIPQWQDEEVRDRERLEVVKYAQAQVGFSQEEIENASDARAIELLYKAWKWDNLQKKKPTAKKRTRKAPKMAKAGQPKTKKQVASRSRQEAMGRLNREKTVDAAVQYLMGNS
jgi:hypothetical protein